MSRKLPGSPHGPTAPPTPRLIPTPRVGLVGMFIAFGLVAGGYAALTLYGSADDRPRTPETPLTSEDASGGPPGIRPEDALRATQAELAEWFQAADRQPINDRVAVDEEEWVQYLLLSPTRRHIDRIPERVFGGLDDLARLRQEPGTHRGRLVTIWGQVESVEEVDLLSGAEARLAWRLWLRDAAGVPWVATCAAAPPDEVTSDSWVKVYGTFVKLRPVPDGSDSALHVFCTRSPAASFPPVTHTEPRVEWLEQIKDGDNDGEDSVPIQPEPFYGMLNYVQHLGPDGYARLRDSGELEVLDLTGPEGATALANQPQLHRFEAVRLRVAPVHDTFAEDALLPENPGNIEMVYKGYVVDDQMRPTWLISPFPASAFDFEGAVIVEVEGFFYKRRYTVAENGKPFWMPVVFATSMRTVVKPPPPIVANPLVIGGAVVLASLVMLTVFVVAVVRGRRGQQAVRERQAERRARRHGNASGDASA